MQIYLKKMQRMVDQQPHCDGMIQEVIELIDQMEKEND